VDADDRAAIEQEVRAAWNAKDFEAASTAIVAKLGPEILRYLHALSRDDASAGDAFSQFCENVWLGLPKFRGESTFRVWAYALARHAWYRVLRDPHRRARKMPLSAVPSVELAAAEVRARTAEYLRSETKDKLAELRASLDADDQSLLILRLNRGLEWNEIARALADPDEQLDGAELSKRAASLRKRFQRIKDELSETMKREQG
jgi:RNA polymerase sigma-70 factor (ECF subfamily)